MAVTCLAIALAGVLALPHTNGPLWLRALGRVLAGLLALGFTAAAVLLYRVGHAAHWTGDGPGMLVVMLLIPVAAFCALAAWFAALWPSRSGRTGSSPWIAIGMILVGGLGFAKGARDYQLEQRHAHDAPVLALQFVDGGALLVACDGGGTLTRWRVTDRELLDRSTLAELAGARQVLIARDGRFVVALVEGAARIVPLGADGPAVRTLPGVTDAALLSGDDLALAVGNDVRIIDLSAPERPREVRSFPARVTALAADAKGGVYAAREDRALVALGLHGEPDRAFAALPGAARRLAASPGGAWLVALDAEGRPTIVDARSGGLRQPDAWIRMHALAFPSERQLVFTTAEGDPSALALSLEDLRTEPWFNHGQAVTAIAATAGVPDAAVALGGDLLLVPAPVPGANAYASTSLRLVSRRF